MLNRRIKTKSIPEWGGDLRQCRMVMDGSKVLRGVQGSRFIVQGSRFKVQCWSQALE
jgi:hypothetical protein